MSPPATGDARPRLIMRGIAPALPGEFVHAIEVDAARALAVAGTPDEPAAIKAIARHFWRARRVAPEIVIVASLPIATIALDPRATR